MAILWLSSGQPTANLQPIPFATYREVGGSRTRGRLEVRRDTNAEFGGGLGETRARLGLGRMSHWSWDYH
jgi:hypothetical protein